MALDSNFSEERSDRMSRAMAIWEISSIVTSCLIAEWVVLSFAGASKLIAAIPVVLAVGFMIFSERERGESAREIGFRLDNFLAACRLLVIPTVAALVLILGVAWGLGGSIAISPFRSRFLLLPLWALFQQYALNGFVNRRSQIAFGKGTNTVLLVALIFASLHLPNLWLAVITFVGGVVWAWVYQRQPNLFALAVSHAICSLALALTLAPKFLNSLRVGFKYFG
jgi:membrane protease YdiL (CAAX protease family)